MLRVEELTVGIVAGLIAAGVFVAQFFLPMLVILILVGLLRNENSAATWSVVGRALHSSHWPTILRTDTAGAKGVRGTVRLVALLQLFLALLISIASIVTPLGLYEAVLPGDSAKEVLFNYTKDETTMGLGTLPRRNDMGFSRWCINIAIPKVCPFTETVLHETSNATTYHAELPLGYDDRIPKNYTEIYSAGVSKLAKTVSSVFDIQWRTYKIREEPDLGWEGRKTHLVGDYRHLSQMVLNNRLDVVDGLVVDTKTGGIGFRNHSIPPTTPYGSAWEEDLLFIELETECVDLNITLDFALGGNVTSDFSHLVLTDRGGFANFDSAMPKFDTNKTWENADLKGRAQLAGWFTNALSMVYLNVTNPKDARHSKAFQYLESQVNKTFPLETQKLGAFRPRHDQLMLKTEFGAFLSPPDAFSNGSLFDTGMIYSNPFKINADNFSEIAVECSRINSRSYANISNIAVGCGMLLGAARRKDGSSSLLFDPGTEWTIPMYSCASAAKASIKTVYFRYNGTAGLPSLKVDDIQPKKYSKDEDKPLWAVEKSALRLNWGNPIWGITSPEYANHPNISTARQEHLYLPGFVDPLSVSPTNGAQNVAGIDFYAYIRNLVYSMDTPDVSATYGIPDYTGRSNMALYSRWQQLSRTPEDAAKIINLIWTDISANAVVGTKGQLPSAPLQGLGKRDDPAKPAMVPVTVYTRRVRFKLQYGIPAFLALVLGAAIFATALVFVVIGRAGPGRLRRYLDQTSTGRIFTAFLYPNDCPPAAPKNTWANLVGAKHIDVGGPVPRRVDAASAPVVGAAPGSAQGNIAYEKMDAAAVSLHSLPSPQPYSPVGSPAQGYFNGAQGSQYTYVPQASGTGTLHPNGGGYT